MYTVEKFSIGDNEWTVVPMLPNAAFGHAAAVTNKRIFISGGQKFDGHSKVVMSFDPVTDVWRDEPSLLTARSNHNMAEVGIVDSGGGGEGWGGVGGDGRVEG